MVLELLQIFDYKVKISMERSFEILLYGRQFRKLIEQELDCLQKEYDLCKIDMHILFYLFNAGDKNTSRDIRNLKLFTKGHISQSLNRLQNREFIYMVQDKRDKRCMHIILNKTTEGIISRIHNAYDRINKIVFQNITEEEIQVLESVANKINDNIKSVIEESKSVE